jgi:hypothetical protein
MPERDAWAFLWAPEWTRWAWPTQQGAAINAPKGISVDKLQSRTRR